MSRPTRNNVDYFPHPVNHGKKMSYLEKKYKNDGYATWMKILEELGDADYHYLDLSDEIQVMFLSDKCLVSEEVLFQIINDLIRMKEFDKELWEENKILFNEKFVESIEDAYKKRSSDCINRNSLLTLLSSLGIRKLNKSNPKPNKSIPKGGENPQRKVKESKVKKTKGEDKKKLNRFLPPTQDEVYDYMIEKKLHPALAEKEAQKFMDFYSSKNWMIGKNKMANWKSAISGWINRMGNFKNNSNAGPEPTINRQTANTIYQNSQGW